MNCFCHLKLPNGNCYEVKDAAARSSIDEIKNDTESLDSRIDNLILTAGDSSAECSDARVNYNGSKTYSVLKNRLDSEYVNHSDKINNLNKSVYEEISIPFEIGTLNSSNGQEGTNTKRMRTSILYSQVKPHFIVVPEGMQIALFYYYIESTGSTLVFVNSTEWLTGNVIFTEPEYEYTNYKIIARYSPERDIVDDDLTKIKLYRPKFMLDGDIKHNKIIGYANTGIRRASDGSTPEQRIYDGYAYLRTDFMISDFIPVTVGESYTGSLFANTGFYDANFNVIQVLKGDDIINNQITIPNSVAYVRLCWKTAKGDHVYFAKTSDYYGIDAAPDLAVKKDNLITAAGKKIAIIGDSISTNGNTGTDSNVPEIIITQYDIGVELSAYLTYYDVDAGLVINGHTFTSSEIGTEVTFTPAADDVGKVIGLPNNYNANTVTTWWEHLCTNFGATAIPVCWSGSSITSHESNTDSKKCSHAWHESQIRKCGIRTPGTMTRTAPDIIFIYRGTNDMSHSPYTLLSDQYFNNPNFAYPTTDEISGGYGYKEGMVLLISKLRVAYPKAKIFLCTLNIFKRVNCESFPTNNGINTLPQYSNAIREIADYMGCGIIEFDKDGITFENCYNNGFITDSSTNPTHPSNKGHYAMGQKAIADMIAQWSKLEV